MNSLSVVLMQTALPNQTDDELVSSDDLYTGVCETVGSQVPRENVQYINGTADIEGIVESVEFFEALLVNDHDTMKSLLPSSVTEFFKNFEARSHDVFTNATADTVAVFVIYNTSLFNSTGVMLNTVMSEQVG